MTTQRERQADGSGKQARPEPEGIGARLRAEREARNISMRQLARRLDISPSALSQVETGTSRPSVRTLYAIVSELGLSLDEIFRPELKDGGGRDGDGGVALVQGAESRKVIELESGVRWERLTPMPDQAVDFLCVTYEVGGASSTSERLARHSGREYGLVMEGRLKITVGFESYELGPGDSISFDSTTPHRLVNEGDVPVRAVWFVTGRHGSDPRAQGLQAPAE